tara:strand:+ start:85 stop:1071 length:987 start_codon:yes stop_codon:yes gene_type:complete
MKAFYIVVGVVIGIIINILFVPFIFSEYYDMKDKGKKNKYKATSSKISIPITKGVCNLIKNKETIDTYDFTKDLYVDLKPSVNRIGGTQFTYSFWLRRNRTVGLDNKILFFRGSERKDKQEKGFIYKSSGTGNDETIDNPEFNKLEPGLQSNERFIKCPLVRFVHTDENSGLKIEFNTLKDPHKYITLDATVFKLLKSSKQHPKYNLITISFQDNFDYGGTERGIKIEVFIDDALVKTSSFENNSLKINNGPIVLFANSYEETKENIDADFAELTYHNYAMDIHDVDTLYKKGFSDMTCALPDSWNNNGNRYTLAKINLYNETNQIMD